MTKIRLLLVVALALLAPAVPAYGAGDARSQARPGLPEADEAREIVSLLWAERERALNTSDLRAVGAYAVASAKSHDDVYLRNVRSGDTPHLVPHPIVKIVPQIPRGSHRPVFFAQVLTTNGQVDTYVWYVVAVERLRSGKWKFGFVSFGNRDAASPPISRLTRSDAYTPRMTADAQARATRQARFFARGNPIERTDEGVVIRSRGAIDVAAEGVYALALSSGEVLSCFTWHTIGTVTYPAGVLEQRAPAWAFGHVLAPGDYRSVRIDNAVAQCTLGTGERKRQPALIMQDLQRTAAIRGVRA